MSPAVGACVRSPSPVLLICAPSRCQPLPQVRVSPPCSLSDKIWQTLCYTDLKEELLMPALRWSSVWESCLRLAQRRLVPPSTPAPHEPPADPRCPGGCFGGVEQWGGGCLLHPSWLPVLCPLHPTVHPDTPGQAACCCSIPSLCWFPPSRQGLG